MQSPQKDIQLKRHFFQRSEFINWFKSHTTENTPCDQKYLSYPEQQERNRLSQKIFNILDRNKDRILSFQELKNLFLHQKVWLNDEEVQKFFNFIDQNKSNKISEHEFMQSINDKNKFFEIMKNYKERQLKMKQNIYVPYSFDKLCNNFSYKTLRQECYKELSKSSDLEDDILKRTQHYQKLLQVSGDHAINIEKGLLTADLLNLQKGGLLELKIKEQKVIHQLRNVKYKLNQQNIGLYEMKQDTLKLKNFVNPFQNQNKPKNLSFRSVDSKNSYHEYQNKMQSVSESVSESENENNLIDSNQKQQQQLIIDSKQQLIIDSKQQSIIDSKQQSIIDSKQQSIIESKQQQQLQINDDNIQQSSLINDDIQQQLIYNDNKLQQLQQNLEIVQTDKIEQIEQINDKNKEIQFNINHLNDGQNIFEKDIFKNNNLELLNQNLDLTYLNNKNSNESDVLSFKNYIAQQTIINEQKQDDPVLRRITSNTEIDSQIFLQNPTNKYNFSKDISKFKNKIMDQKVQTEQDTKKIIDSLDSQRNINFSNRFSIEAPKDSYQKNKEGFFKIITKIHEKKQIQNFKDKSLFKLMDSCILQQIWTNQNENKQQLLVPQSIRKHYEAPKIKTNSYLRPQAATLISSSISLPKLLTRFD